MPHTLVSCRQDRVRSGLDPCCPVTVSPLSLSFSVAPTERSRAQPSDGKASPRGSLGKCSSSLTVPAARGASSIPAVQTQLVPCVWLSERGERGLPGQCRQNSQGRHILQKKDQPPVCPTVCPFWQRLASLNPQLPCPQTGTPGRP